MQLRSDQQTLATMQTKLSNRTHTAVGAMGEQTAAALLRQSGYTVHQVAPGQRHGDLLAIDPDTGEMWKVEVKTSRRSKRGYQFCLRKKDQHGHTNASDADIVLLLAVLKTGRVVVFVVPVAALGEQKCISFRTHPEDYAGRLAGYRCRGQRINLGVGQ